MHPLTAVGGIHRSEPSNVVKDFIFGQDKGKFIVAIDYFLGLWGLHY